MIYNPDGSYKHMNGNRWPMIKRRLFITFIVAIIAGAGWVYVGYTPDRKLQIALESLQEYCDAYKVDFYDFEAFPDVFPAPNATTFVFDYKSDPFLELRVVVPKDPWDATQTFLYRRQKPRKSDAENVKAATAVMK